MYKKQLVILLRKGETNTMTVTLTEKQVTDSPDYVFVFKNSDNEEITVSYDHADDTSDYPERYNSFQIVTNTHFLNKKTGLYTYRIYENEAGGTLLECGIMKLLPAADATFTEYQGEEVTYKSYNAS